jgi:hypothetical protein
MPREPYGSQIPPKPPKRKGAKTMANKPKTTKDGSPMKPKWMRDVKLDPLSSIMPRYAQSKRMTGEAQSIAKKKVAKRKATVADRLKMKSSTTADSKRKTGQAIKMLGKKKAPSSYALGITKKQKGR